eukprot:962905-Alexandrium_andersonii.AAC.1
MAGAPAQLGPLQAWAGGPLPRPTALRGPRLDGLPGSAGAAAGGASSRPLVHCVRATSSWPKLPC